MLRKSNEAALFLRLLCYNSNMSRNITIYIPNMYHDQQEKTQEMRLNEYESFFKFFTENQANGHACNVCNEVITLVNTDLPSVVYNPDTEATDTHLVCHNCI